MVDLLQMMAGSQMLQRMLFYYFFDFFLYCDSCVIWNDPALHCYYYWIVGLVVGWVVQCWDCRYKYKIQYRDFFVTDDGA